MQNANIVKNHVVFNAIQTRSSSKNNKHALKHKNNTLNEFVLSGLLIQ